MSDRWWRESVFYQVYPLSFKDHDGNGYGDLKGIESKLDYLVWLGVDAVWLSPVYQSPMADWGYDVSDHTDIDRLFGDMGDFDSFLESAHERGLKILMDLVLNHTSDQHPWFVESRSSQDNPKRDWYVWESGEKDHPPNNWVSVFSGPAWSWDDTTGQWYRHTYLPVQPDLNWRNPDVVEAMMGVIRFWLDRGVDGFRVDAAHQIMKDPANRDNPPTPPGFVDPYKEMGEYGRWIHLRDLGHADVHEIHRQVRKITEEYERGIVTVGEIHEFDPARWLAYFGSGDELTMPFNYNLMVSDWTASSVRAAVETVEALLPEWAWTNWTMGNHDEVRIASRLGDSSARQAAVLLTTLRGTPFLYYGDEVGMLNGSNQGRDPWGDNVAFLSRDGCRTPMQWDGSKLVGFGESKPWIPIGPEPGKRNVEVQRDDPESLLTLYRNLLAIRKKRVSLQLGDYQTLESPHEDVLIYLRSIDGESTTVAINFGEEAVQLNRLGDPVITVGGYEPYDGLVFLGPGAVVIWDSTAYGLPHPLSSSS